MRLSLPGRGGAAPRRLADDLDDDALTDPRFFLVRRFQPGTFPLSPALRRHLVWAGGLAGALLAMLVALRAVMSLPPVARWLEGEAHRAVSERLPGAEIRGGVHVGWFGSVRLEDLRVSGADPAGPPVLSAQEVVVHPSLAALLGGHLRVADIELRWVRLHPGARGEALRPLLEHKGDAKAGTTTRHHQAPTVSVRDLYVDLPLAGASDIATLGPLSFRARWTHLGDLLEWDVRGGLLDGHAGRFRFQGRENRADHTAHATAKLEALELVDLPPGWFGAFSIQPQHGTLSGEFDGGRDAVGALAGTGHFAVKALSVLWPRLDPDPVSPLAIDGAAAFHWDPAARILAVTGGKLTVNGGTLTGDATLTLGDPRSVDVDLQIAHLDLQKAIDSLPKTLQPPPEAPRVEGELNAELSVGGPLGDLDGIEIKRAVVDLKSLRRAAKGDPSADYLNRPFRYTPRDDEGPHRSFEVGPGNPRFVAYSSLPSYVPRAVVASEDAGFFWHHGFDFDEIKESIARDIETGEAVRGGSTLTQQLVKNLFLSRSKTLSRKIREALITLQVEATLPKWRILEIYLNTIEWGPDVYGIGEAAWRYFGVPASRLTPKEAAFLATIIPAPKRFYHLYVERGAVTPRWEERVDHLVSRMRDFGYLDQDAAAAALSEPIVFHHGAAPREADRGAESPEAPRARTSSLWERLFGR